MTVPAAVCVDLGKTRCRVTFLRAGAEPESRSAPGLPGLAAPGAVEQTAAVITALTADLPDDARHAPVGVGAAGALTAPDAAAALAAVLATSLAAPVAVASDIVTAHIGAFDGAPGVCLVAGTGAVALGVGATGMVSRRDGLGLTVGDLGSGAWIGRTAVRAAELAQAGVAPATDLTRRIPDAAATASALAGAPDAAARLARFAPAVLEAAATGDATAADIVVAATTALAETAHGAAVDTGGLDVVALGGLTDAPIFHTALRTALASRGLTLRAPVGSAIDGARVLATRHDLLLEGYIHRARP